MAKSSRKAVLVLALLGAGALIWLLRPDPASEAPPAPLSSASATTATPAPAPSIASASPTTTSSALPAPRSVSFSTMEQYRASRAAMVVTPVPMEPPPAGRTPQTEVAMVRMKLRDYRAAYGSNPVGSNAEITRALLGTNPRGAKYLDPSSVSLNASGEMLDRWGQPYFFHALSGTMMEVRSAGPDGVLFNADDIVGQ